MPREAADRFLNMLASQQMQTGRPVSSYITPPSQPMSQGLTTEAELRRMLFGDTSGSTGQTSGGTSATSAMHTSTIGFLPISGTNYQAFIDFEISEGEYDRTRQLYEELLERTKHLKVWISYAKFEASAKVEVAEGVVSLDENRKCIQNARRVFEKAINYFRTSAPEVKEERTMLLEEWLNMETSFCELGDVSLVQPKLPKKLKRRRPISSEDGLAGLEEYIDYIFPEENQAPNLKILEAAYQWKKQKLLSFD